MKRRIDSIAVKNSMGQVVEYRYISLDQSDVLLDMMDGLGMARQPFDGDDVSKDWIEPQKESRSHHVFTD